MTTATFPAEFERPVPAAASAGTPKEPAATAPVADAVSAPAERGPGFGERLGALMRRVIPPLLGFAFVVGVWALVAMKSADFPGPVKTFEAALALFADPFYQNGPNDQGIGWNILSSLKRVAIGFGVAALVGIPLGFIIGRFAFIKIII